MILASNASVPDEYVTRTRELVKERGLGDDMLAMLGILPDATAETDPGVPVVGRARRLTPDSVREIRRLHSGGLTYTRIADRFGVGIPTVSAVVNRKTWRHVA